MNVIQIVDTDVCIGDMGLHMQLPDGNFSYFNYYWLRDNCPTSFDPTTRERCFDIFHLPQAPQAETAVLEDGALIIGWAGENHVSRIPVEMLMAFTNGQRRPDPADLPRVAWFSDHFSDVPRFSQPELLADPCKVAEWIEALLIEGLAIITDMPDSDKGLTDLAKLIGHIRPTFFGEYFDVRTHINPTNTAFTAGALELHTDVPAEEFAPGIQFLHCRANTVRGGQSVYADGVAVANDFRKIDPEGFRLLSEIDVPFYCEHDTYDMRARQKVIELDENGDVSGLTISQHMLDISDLSQKVLDDYYPAFCRFGKMLQDDRYVMKFLMKGGECMTFDNHRIVHGREAYTASSGERYLRGTYTDRAEMRSTYRALVSSGRFKA
ncbi:MAG: gamma-butyrobetaine dioxygenase [Paracoccaceae bacterium]|jgi:gamma-butyrobetaine dioxygenase